MALFAVQNWKMEFHVPFKHRRTTLERAEKFISTHHFTDINLRSRLYPAKTSVTAITHYAAPGRVPYEDAIKGTYEKATVGQSFGPTWTTHWFCLEIDVPREWVGREVRLLWNSNSEALVWVNGQPRLGLSKIYDRFDFILSYKQGEDSLRYTIYVEMACNGLFGVGKNSMIGPADPDRYFTLQQAQVAIFDRDVYSLIMDVEILHNMAKELPDSERGYQALYAANDLINACDVKDKSTFKKAKEISSKFFSQRNGDSQHTIHAVGHAHIDTAWLWPYDETKRKCARSWSCSLRLMEQYPEFKFTCSQAQQFEWVKENYPSMYKDICKFVANGQFIPVGGTWVEMDGYIPSGEAFVRQFLYGQRYFQREFGIKCTEFWLPDTFGYATQLPQIMRECGITRFVTQKLSWSLVNKFPHHTFWWEGLDGSKVLTHFPPGDSYEMKGEVKELLFTVKNFRDKGRSPRSLFLFGHGDGGNGPHENMLQRLERMENVDGLPKVKMSTPDEFFTAVEKEDADKLCTWRGELYLELHNGTYTTHAKVKARNRRCEFLLQEVEQVWACLLAVKGRNSPKVVYPQKEVERLWKLLLLNQFHDVLPGSSISIVYDDAHRLHSEIEEEGAKLLKKAISMFGNSMGDGQEDMEAVLVNTVSWDRRCILPLSPSCDGLPPKQARTGAQTDLQGNTLVCVEARGCGIAKLEDSIRTVEEPDFVHIQQEGESIIMSNSHVRAVIDSSGRLTSLRSAGSSRELLASGCPGNQLLLYEDIPLYWDAWDVMDYHLETRNPLTHVIQKAAVKENGPLRASIEVKIGISEDSVVTQTIQLDAESPFIAFNTQVDWHENRKFLKVEFPTTIHSMQATYEVQYGVLQRPNHYNTSWDAARFEVCGQKWADLSQHGLGLSLLTDSKYGYSAVGGVLRLSLLRSPKAPDAHADMGSHSFCYAVMPHTGSWQEAGVVQASFNLNRPLHLSAMTSGPSLSLPARFFWLQSPQAVLDTVKPSEDCPGGKLIVRLYEAFGGQAQVCLFSSLAFTSACRCNCLEEPMEGGNLPVTIKGGVTSLSLELRPFQIISLILTF